MHDLIKLEKYLLNIRTSEIGLNYEEANGWWKLMKVVHEYVNEQIDNYYKELKDDKNEDNKI